MTRAMVSSNMPKPVAAEEVVAVHKIAKSVRLPENPMADEPVRLTQLVRAAG